MLYEVITTRFEFEKIESSQRNVIRQAYTQMQAAVPSTYDKLFSTYNNALSRDWWRVSKCFERIKEVNRITSYNVCYTKLLRVFSP